ncbi:Rab family GTPase [Flavobacterium branchiophilum]|uniref:Small GTP-binding protein, Ras family n=2 Tax=Flavobacterium branchiophilum TaxID=55197 RepID=G2Z092_FLABF|nr:Rab family GTPase [Flavobacterium branchiophilum]PDS23854.1 GTP-binding protein [Flavobacterium branchiophilum]CCB70710.1 Small GTP-binding protein, Ras family [Flavobacterium branchiophilum FL-15]
MSKTKKIVLTGHFGVGKSSLIRRFVQNEFSDDYHVTIGVHILKKTVALNNDEITLVIWDIEGKDSVEKIRSSYLIGTSGFIHVIDPTRGQTFSELQNEIKYLNKSFPKTPIITVCNKSDLIAIDEFEALLKTKNLIIDYFTSAKLGENVEKIFQEIASKITAK